MLRSLRAFEEEHPIMLVAFGVGVSSLTYWSCKIFGAGDKATAVGTALAAIFSIGVPSMMYLYRLIRDRLREMKRNKFIDQLDQLYEQLMQVKFDLLNFLDLLPDQLLPCPKTILYQGDQLLARQDQLLNQLCVCRVRAQLTQDQVDLILDRRDQLINQLGRVLEQLIQEQGDWLGQLREQLIQEQGDLLGQLGQQRNQFLDQLYEQLMQVKFDLLNLLDLLYDQLQSCPKTILDQGDQLSVRQDQLLNQLCLCLVRRARGQLIQDQGDQRDQLINQLGQLLAQLIQDQGDWLGQLREQLIQDQGNQLDQLIDRLGRLRAQLIQNQRNLLGQPREQDAMQTQSPEPVAHRTPTTQNYGL